MDRLRESIRKLKTYLVPGISAQEDKEVRAEIDILESEYKKEQIREKDKANGISQYGSYFSS